MIYDRSPITESVIAFLVKDTEGKLLTYPELIASANNPKASTIQTLRPYLSSATKFMRAQHGVKYGTIRGQGIQRMTADEVAFYGDKRYARAKRQFKEGLKDNRLVAMNNGLSTEARTKVTVNNVVFLKLIQEIERVPKTIEFATVDGGANLAAILKNM